MRARSRKRQKDALVAAKQQHSVRLEALVDGLNRRVDEQTLEAAQRGVRGEIALRAEPSSPAEVAAWLSERLRK